MNTRITWDWLRKFYNTNKNASYQDKWFHLLNEKNPFYLLEWLIFPVPTAVEEELHHPRSQGLARNSYVAFTEVFFHQLLYDICFSQWTRDDLKTLLLRTAVYDLRNVYGVSRWDSCLEKWLNELHATVDRYQEFETVLAKTKNKIKLENDELMDELALAYNDNPQMLEEKRITAKTVFHKKMEEAPRKLLLTTFGDNALVAYMHLRQWSKPSQTIGQWSDNMQRIKLPYVEYVNNTKYDALYSKLLTNPTERQRFTDWFPAYGGKSGLTRGCYDSAGRQSWWAGLLQYMANDYPEADMRDIWDRTFEIAGIEETLLQTNTIPNYMHLLVWHALEKEGQSEWIKDKLLLRNWPIFRRAFLSDFYDFHTLSWVLCLDPSTIVQRLLRPDPRDKTYGSTSIDPKFIVERCCQLFTDAIKFGVHTRPLVSIYRYLAAHDHELLFQIIHGIKYFDALVPIFSIDERILAQMFAGNNIRSKSVRLHLHPLFVEKALEPVISEEDALLMRKIGFLLAEDKGVLLQDWFRAISHAGNHWSDEIAQRMSQWLSFEWLGIPLSDKDHEGEHQLIAKILEQHSDWVKYEADAPPVFEENLQYRIIQPGAIDMNNNLVLSRILVGFQLTNNNDAALLLEDLKNL